MENWKQPGTVTRAQRPVSGQCLHASRMRPKITTTKKHYHMSHGIALSFDTLCLPKVCAMDDASGQQKRRHKRFTQTIANRDAIVSNVGAFIVRETKCLFPMRTPFEMTSERSSPEPYSTELNREAIDLHIRRTEFGTFSEIPHNVLSKCIDYNGKDE